MLVEASTAMRSSTRSSPPPLALALLVALAPLAPLASPELPEPLSPLPQAMAASASAPVRIAASASFGTWMRFIIGASLIQRLGWIA